MYPRVVRRHAVVVVLRFLSSVVVDVLAAGLHLLAAGSLPKPSASGCDLLGDFFVLWSPRLAGDLVRSAVTPLSAGCFRLLELVVFGPAEPRVGARRRVALSLFWCSGAFASHLRIRCRCVPSPRFIGRSPCAVRRPRRCRWSLTSRLRAACIRRVESTWLCSYWGVQFLALGCRSGTGRTLRFCSRPRGSAVSCWPLCVLGVVVVVPVRVTSRLCLRPVGLAWSPSSDQPCGARLRAAIGLSLLSWGRTHCGSDRLCDRSIAACSLGSWNVFLSSCPRLPLSR